MCSTEDASRREVRVHAACREKSDLSRQRSFWPGRRRGRARMYHLAPVSSGTVRPRGGAGCSNPGGRGRRSSCPDWPCQAIKLVKSSGRVRPILRGDDMRRSWQWRRSARCPYERHSRASRDRVHHMHAGPTDDECVAVRGRAREPADADVAAGARPRSPRAPLAKGRSDMRSAIMRAMMSDGPPGRERYDRW